MSDATPNESFLQRHSRDVVERLIRQMEEGTGPFLKPWDARVDLGLPMNPTTGKNYRGGNLLHLWALQSTWDSQDNRWMTYKQAAAVGAQVRKGEKASVIEYWDWSPVEEAKKSGDPELIAKARPKVFFPRVFNAMQIDGLPALVLPPPRPEPDIHQACEAVLNRLVTYQAGDVFAGPSSSPVNLGGVRVAKDPRALDPLTPTYPVPMLGGVALDPATVEVLANRARVLQGRVGKGPFTADGSALGTGAQQTQVVVRDPYGRETVVSDQRFYVAPTLLRKGLTTWEIAAGRVRQGESDYRTLGATGSVAWGLNDRWTLRGTAQTSMDGKVNVALGATTVLGTYGTLDLELGTSTQGGQRQALAYDYRGPRFGVRLEHERQQGYWRLRAPSAVEVEQRTRGSVFWRPTPQWSLRAGLSDVRTPRFRTAYADAGLTWRGNGHTVAVSALRDLELKETRVEVGYSYDFGRGKGVSVRARQAPAATAWAVQGRARPTVLGTPVGLSASVDEGAAGQTARANANWTTRAGWAQITVEHGPSSTWTSGSMAGAVHLDRQGVTFLGPAESFAVVDVPGQAGVPVRVGGRLVGRTNAQGRLVVGEVTPMVPTEVRVDDRALPLGTQLAEIEQTATAGRQAGMHLTFPVLTETARTFRLKGPAIEAGTVAKTATETTQVGYDGVLYLEQPRPSQTVEVEGVCKAQLPADLGAAQTVAEVACR
ncbi:hypothetical protein CEE61_10055 [Stenotrophomonas maltophilia]|uniref:ArdC-like ssDNA-binding domain-containing protein n=2 Tax=Stenotrophomonas TaxID=40323 RepID=UPI000B4C3014|nr:DUF1738 domain-containing protein [Stenotrophomonas sp. M37]MRF21528.1 DUF1738 domain-containing protein [Stenotrophomonas sp. MY18]MRF50213.1 DUF1738 domain-containing protein [Stenotrophomonas sp. MY15]MRG16722.1 DUF1738 domain-containing protein [Stenotrophomonas sp. MY17]OWQ57814.1 hypothetical protein CEE61_10055 [Stenotrophomonas maltophilia]